MPSGNTFSPILETKKRNRKLLGAKGIPTRSKDATSNKCIATSNKCLTSSNKKLVETSALLLGARTLLGSKKHPSQKSRTDVTILGLMLSQVRGRSWYTGRSF